MSVKPDGAKNLKHVLCLMNLEEMKKIRPFAEIKKIEGLNLAPEFLETLNTKFTQIEAEIKDHNQQLESDCNAFDNFDDLYKYLDKNHNKQTEIAQKYKMSFEFKNMSNIYSYLTKLKQVLQK